MTQAPALGADAMIASLRLIMPPAALIHVGVGRGTGAMHKWHDWNVPSAWLVDAEPEQLAWTERLAAARPEWQVHSATLAETDGQALYYSASNPAESGLVSTSKLAALWPNLRAIEQTERATMRLDTLLANNGNLAEGVGAWLIVDCLPALRVLQGAAETLERCSVLWLRTLLKPLPEGEAGTTLEELKAFAEPLGFRCVHITEGNHPALGEAIFVRDWAQRLQPAIDKLLASDTQHQQQALRLEEERAAQEASAKVTAQESEAHAKLASTRQAQLDKLDVEKTELTAKLASSEQAHATLASKLKALETENATKLEALVKEKAELANKLDALTKTHAEVGAKLAAADKQQTTTAEAIKEAQSLLATRTSERDAQAKLANECQAKTDALSKEKTELATKLDAQTKLATERQTQVEALGKEKTTIAEKLAAADTAKHDLSKRSETLQGQVEQLTKSRDEQAKLASDRAAQSTQLTTQRDNLSKENQSLKSDTQTKDAAIAKLNGRIAEQDQRERQLVEEIVRAEAQIELIKDLLLREGGL